MPQAWKNILFHQNDGFLTVFLGYLCEFITESTQKTTKNLRIARENLLSCHISHKSPEDLQFFDKCDFGPIQYLFNNFSPFHLPEARSISFDRAHLALSSERVLSKNDIEILSFGINSGYFWSKSPKKYKNTQKLNEAGPNWRFWTFETLSHAPWIPRIW
jgi:hypothetical protein